MNASQWAVSIMIECTLMRGVCDHSFALFNNSLVLGRSLSEHMSIRDVTHLACVSVSLSAAVIDQRSQVSIANTRPLTLMCSHTLEDI